MAQEREIQSWITIKHKHVPIFKGETVQDAVNRFKESHKPAGVKQPGGSSESKNTAFKMVEKGWEYQTDDGKYTLKKDYITERKKGDYPSSLLAPKQTVASWKVYSKNDPNTIHSFHSLKDAQDFVKEDMKKYSTGIKDTKPNPVKQKDPEAIAQRFSNNLSKQGISNEWEIENWLMSKSAGYRNSLAKDIGIEGKGDDRVKALAHKLYVTGKNGGADVKTDVPSIKKPDTEAPKLNTKPEPIKVETPKEPEYERTPKMDWIDKRIEGKQKELEKAEKKMERILKAKESDYKENNPYYYSDYDLRSTQKDIDKAKADIEKYKQDMEVEISKAKNRNVPAITNFLNDWKDKTIEYYNAELPNYQKAREEYRKKEREYTDWFNNESHKLRQTMDPAEFKALYKQKWDEERNFSKNFNDTWRFVTQFYDGAGTWEENMKKAVEQERIRKYDDIITRTNDLIGQITDAGGLTVGKNGDLNGLIVGKNGKVYLETIGAGGYNIQRYHFRTLINKLKEK